MALFGDLITKAMGGYPEKPRVPIWKDINLGEEQQKATASNLAALPGLESLASKTNAFNIDQITKLLQGTIPDYDQLTKTASSNIESLLKGEIPQDVQDQVQMNAAARALMGGYAGSGAAGNLMARDLGLTSLDLTQKGLNSAERWINMTSNLYQPGQLNVTSMFISPSQMFEADMRNQTNKWNQQWLTNQIRAMPDPGQAAIARDVGGMVDIAGSVLGGILGEKGMAMKDSEGNTSQTGLNLSMIGSAVAAAGGGGGGL